MSNFPKISSDPKTQSIVEHCWKSVLKDHPDKYPYSRAINFPEGDKPVPGKQYTALDIETFERVVRPMPADKIENWYSNYTGRWICFVVELK